MSEFVEGQPHEGLVSHAFLLADQYKPEEVRKGNWEMLNGAPPWCVRPAAMRRASSPSGDRAVDAWGVGCLVQEVFSGRKLMRTEDLRELAHIPPVLHKEYQRLLSSAPARRLNPAKILESSLFSNKLVDTLTFLEKLNLKDSADKDLFFRRLNATLDGLPRTVVERKVLPLIASGLEFGSAPGAALQSLLHAARRLAKPQFTARIIPTVIRLFASTDRAMRVALLQCMDAYMELLEPAQMEAVFEQLAAGFGDATAFLRELTLKSMLHVAPKVSQRTLTSSLLKHLAKLQMDDEPAIRANTTICLGNIARYLGEAACKRVLLNAFTRALKDPFPAARAAGLMSLQATIAYYDATEGGLRVLPAITPLTLDPDAKVRAAAFEATDAFLGLLRAHHAQRAPGGSPADDAAAAARPLVCQAEGKAPAPAAGGLLSWASGSVGALAAAMGSPAPDRGKTAGGAPPSPAPKPSLAAARAAQADADEEGAEADRVCGPLCCPSLLSTPRPFSQAEAAARARLSKASLAPPPAADGGDGWGLDDDELEDLEQPSPPPPPPPRPAARTAAPRPPAVKAPPKLGAMKLGAKPLGASKAGDLDLEAMLAD